MKYLIIYLVGCFVSYFSVRWYQREEEHVNRDWVDIITSFFFSWLTAILLVLIVLVDKIPSKPPKWL